MLQTTINNIPNLSEHYIYFNDDIFIGKVFRILIFLQKTEAQFQIYVQRLKKCLFPEKKII